MSDSPTPAARQTGARVRRLLDGGDLDLPLPGSGRTAGRWYALAEIAAQDLSVARLAEGHTDAVAILAELGGPPATGLWGVWAAEPLSARVEAVETAAGWTLRGRKAWCSGADLLDGALVTAWASDGRRLFAIDTAHVAVVEGSWPAVGMAGSSTLAVDLHATPAVPVGGPDAYLSRPGFWHGGGGVAACWYGGALGAGRVLLAAARSRDLDPHALAHLGAVDSLLTAGRDVLNAAAAEIDADPLDLKGSGQLRAQRVRAFVECVATEVLDRVGRALGAAPLCLDAGHARRAADLPVYVRQSHAERDLAGLGSLVVEQATW